MNSSFPLKRHISYNYKILYPRLLGNMLLPVFKNECVKNQMKLVPNTSTSNFLNHLQFTNVSKIKVVGIIWHLILYNLFTYALIYGLIY